jgi:hypothetical protein
VVRHAMVMQVTYVSIRHVMVSTSLANLQCSIIYGQNIRKGYNK